MPMYDNDAFSDNTNYNRIKEEERADVSIKNLEIESNI
jgi:hypothetical protein